MGGGGTGYGGRGGGVRWRPIGNINFNSKETDRKRSQ